MLAWGAGELGWDLAGGQQGEVLKQHIWRPATVPVPAASPPWLLLAVLALADQALQASIYFCPHFHVLLSLPQALVNAACWGLINLAGSVNLDQLK